LSFLKDLWADPWVVRIERQDLRADREGEGQGWEEQREDKEERDLLADVNGFHEHLTLQIVEGKFETNGGWGFELKFPGLSVRQRQRQETVRAGG
jgi:hypothetical protein